jgi:hypothetical protein
MIHRTTRPATPEDPMTDRQPHLLSPYRPPTSYPVSLNADEAAAWLNGYAALWHPAVLRGASRPPQPSSSYDHDQPGAGYVYAVPQGPHLYQPDDWLDRVAQVKAVAFTATASRSETFANLRQALETASETGPLLDAPVELVRLFCGVGYGYLMLDTLCEAMGHDRLLDLEAFWADLTAAVEATAQPDGAKDAKNHLKAAAEKLHVAREGVYSGVINLLDWIILTPDTLGGPWPEAVTAGVPAVLIAEAESLERLAVEHPQRFAELKARAPANLPASVDVCCGVYRERDDALLPPESQFWTFMKARQTIAKLFGAEPTVFARWRSAHHPQLPSWLLHVGYRYAVATTFDAALAPSRYAAVINWPAPDGRAIDAFTKEPHPAHDPQTFFNLGYHLHQATTHDAAPTVVILHRGKPPAVGYDDWQALSELAPVLGQWTTLTRYFSDALTGEYTGPASADEFFADYLDDRVTNRRRPDPVSGFARHYRLRRRLDAVFTLAALHRSLTPESADEPELLRQLGELEDAIETRGADIGPAEAADELSRKLEPVETAWAKKLADRVQSHAAEGQPGVMVFNPCGMARRVALELDGFPGPVPAEGVVKASEYEGGVARIVVEVPGLGFAWVPRTAGPVMKPRIKTAEGTLVRNEYFEADLDPATGGLRGFRDARTRINRLAEVLVFNPGSKMRARSVRVTNAGSALGEVVSDGEIVSDHDDVLATFRQRLRAWVGRPALELRIEIQPLHRPTGYPWHAYYGARFAWRDDRTALFRGVNGTNSQTSYPRPVSPDYVEVRFGSQRTFVFTGGLPFVQRHGTRMLDVVLIPEGETATTFDLLLSLDRDHPMQTAAGWAAPAPMVFSDKGPPHIGASGWLGHLDLPSLLLTSLRPAEPGEGRLRAVSARFIETAGYGGAAELRFARDPSRAWLTDAFGVPTQELNLIADAIAIEFSAGEVVTVKAEWV